MKAPNLVRPRLPSEIIRAEDASVLETAEEIAHTALCGVCCPPLDREHVSVEGCSFTGCRFPDFALRHSHFSDVVFRNCDLSNADLRGCSFHRAEFIDCRLTGANLAEGTFAHLLIRRCKAEYVNFSWGKLRQVCFDEAVMRHAVLADCRLECTTFVRCDLTSAEFYGTRLQGISLADSAIHGIRVREIGSYELKGMKISITQAAHLARLLGVEIEE